MVFKTYTWYKIWFIFSDDYILFHSSEYFFRWTHYSCCWPILGTSFWITLKVFPCTMQQKRDSASCDKRIVFFLDRNYFIKLSTFLLFIIYDWIFLLQKIHFFLFSGKHLIFTMKLIIFLFLSTYVEQNILPMQGVS